MAVPLRPSKNRRKPKGGPGRTRPGAPVVRAGVPYDRAFNHLCHVLSLSQTGKPKAALEGMILAVCDLEGGDVAGAAEIKTALDVYFGLRVKSRQLNEAIEELQAQGKLLRSVETGRLRLSPTAQAEVRERTEAGNKLEMAVRGQWLESLRGQGLLVTGHEDGLWKCLQLYMAKVFRQHGALSVELLTPSTGAKSTEYSSVEAALEAGLKDHPCGDQQLARKAIELFFTEVTAERSRYVAQLLDGTFTFFALSIDEAAAQYITKTLPRLSLFLDTNFIFELLGLSHTPSTGDAAVELIEFIKRNNFPFKLYMHGETLAEVERTIGGIGRSALQGRTFSQEISRAATGAPLRRSEPRHHGVALGPGEAPAGEDHPAGRGAVPDRRLPLLQLRSPVPERERPRTWATVSHRAHAAPPGPQALRHAVGRLRRPLRAELRAYRSPDGPLGLRPLDVEDAGSPRHLRGRAAGRGRGAAH